MSGPMAGVAGGELAAAVARAGGLGFIAAGHARDLEFIDQQVKLFRAKTADLDPKPPLSIGFITFCSFPTGHVEEVLKRHRPEIVQFFAPALMINETKESNLELARRYGAKYVMAQVGCLRDIKQAIDAGFDVIIA
eukprot:CAMPEP_0172174600 /NCGR_PEP_ID=MMETSP1050-20130122/13761_1 /TAXON_ID=233186 /ORGANISM="Cryptomonas curvata, Strain CCAP979/52" /LENGTH=135 /DNA_ID=CAMNT_0012846607 /DNA_START=68 /DNA_END=471 /DNA_ORIENTATION=-